MRQAFTSRYLSSKVGWTGGKALGWRVQGGYVMAGRGETDMNLPQRRSISPHITVGAEVEWDASIVAT